MTEPTASDFDGKEAITGLEHLGRAIVDDNGVPSGSPANYEHLRGRAAPGTKPVPSAEESVAKILEEFPREE